MVKVFDMPEKTDFSILYPDVFPAEIFRGQPANLAKDKIIKYIVAVFDIEGLRTKVPDIVKRRRIALEMAGFHRNDDGEWNEHILNMINGKYDVINTWIVYYVRLHKSPQYSYIMAMEAAFYNLMEKTLRGDAVSQADVKAMREMSEDIIRETSLMLNEENNKAILEKTYKFLMEDSLGITPEDIAFKRQQNKPVVDVNPYGKEYTGKKYPRE